MKRWLTEFITIVVAASSISVMALAQINPPPGLPAPGAPTVPAQPSSTPAPTATPDIVGRNVDPAPAPLPQGYPGSAPTAPAAPAALNPARPLSPSPLAQPPKMVEQPNTKSEIISALPPVAKSSELRAVLRTSVGDITIRLDRVNAAKTAAYFVSLAKGDVDFTDIKTSKPVKRPFYNGLIFHRVVKNTLIQTGDPFGNGRGGSGVIIPDEIKPSMKFDRPGLVAMAPMRDGVGTTLAKNSASSQFFITLREMPDWNGQFTIFGEVEDGMDVVQKIANVKVGPTERPIKRIYLVAVEIIESTK
jgi:peptidyl-prolyl cis-trans isomerase A (cyclophilin A)